MCSPHQLEYTAEDLAEAEDDVEAVRARLLKMIPGNETVLEFGKNSPFQIFTATPSSFSKVCHICLTQATVIHKGQLVYRADGSVRDMTEDKLYCDDCAKKAIFGRS